MKTDPLDRLRVRVGKANRCILDDLNERLRLVGEIRRLKIERGLAFHDPKRERQMLRELAKANEGPLTKAQLERVFKEVFAVSLEFLEAGPERGVARSRTKRSRRRGS